MLINIHIVSWTYINPYFNRFFSIGKGYKSDAAFLEKARCGHTYADKFVETITDVKGHAPVRDKKKARSATVDNTSAPGVLHASTRDRLRQKKEREEHRSELYPTFQYTTHTTSQHITTHHQKQLQDETTQ